ncbi:MAG: serine acetyltransferase [Hahellaceae bacterium]|nr:serine acetyltransferase [Hahellaceae bacterium]
MIQSFEDYQAYLEADRLALKKKKTFRNLRFDRIWRFQRLLRRLEYLTNCNGNWLLRRWTSFQFGRMSRLLGFTIPINVFGPGLSIAHMGTIVINPGTRIGANCRLHVCVNIGTEAGKKFAAPVIGDNCYIAPGVKMFGDIVLGSNMVIGANAVVNKSFPEGNVTIGGIPAKVISQKGSDGLITIGHSAT